MKKNLYFLMAVAAMASVSCVNEKIDAPQLSDAVVITADAEHGPEAKTTLSEGAVLWNSGDAITVWNGAAACEFVTSDPDGTASAKFVASSAFAESDSYLALYPHSASAVFAGGKVNTTVSAAQTPKAGGFADGVNVAVAAGSGESLLFKNVCGYVKFTVPAGMTDLTKVEFKANAGEKIAGDINVTVSDEPVAEVAANGADAVVLEGTFEAGASYYIAVLPKTLAGGFTVTMTRGGETSTMSTTKPFTVSRSKAKPIGELYDGTWQVRLEGTAVPEGQTLKLTQTLENKNLFACLDTLNAGKLNLRVLYENVYVATEGGAYTDGGETAYTTSDQACDFEIAAEGLYRIVLNKQTGKLTIYSPATNPKNLTITYNNTAVGNSSYKHELRDVIWMYGGFNKYSGNIGYNKLFKEEYSLKQSLADPYLFVYKGKTLPREKETFKEWSGDKSSPLEVIGGVTFLIDNVQNNVYAWGAAGTDAKRNTKHAKVTPELGASTGVAAGQSDNRYALFEIPATCNYIELDVESNTVIFDKR